MSLTVRPSSTGHHAVYTLDPTSYQPTFVADLGGSMKADGMGTTTTYDYDEKVVYLVTAVMNNSATPPAPYFKHSAVSITDGSVTNLPISLIMQGAAYDSKTKRVYGTAVAAGPGGGGAWAARVDPRTKRAPLGGGGKAERRLSYFETSKRDKLVSVGDKYSLRPDGAGAARRGDRRARRSVRRPVRLLLRRRRLLADGCRRRRPARGGGVPLRRRAGHGEAFRQEGAALLDGARPEDQPAAVPVEYRAGVSERERRLGRGY